MPNYVYRGTDCPHEFEVHQSFSEDPLTECNVCGKPVRRVFQPTGLVFKGSGWYINDSRKSTNGTDKTSAPKKDPSDDTSTAATTAEKAEKPDTSDKTASKEPATASASSSASKD